jgi:hypothetical protein
MAIYLNARDHYQTEQYLAGLPVRHTVLPAGRPYSYRPEDRDTAHDQLRHSGMTDDDATNRASWFDAIAHGVDAGVSDTVVSSSGHAATRIQETEHCAVPLRTDLAVRRPDCGQGSTVFSTA